MQKDKFGRPVESLNYGEDWQPVEWDNTTSEGIVYLRCDYDDMCVIQKVDTNTNKITWAYGSWAARASLAYGTDRLIRG